jgi:hypothetical protein
MNKRRIQNSESQIKSEKSRSDGARGVLFLSGIVGLFATGCQVLTYSGPNGEHFSRSSFGTKTSIAALTLEAGTNGVRRVQLQGYQNDPTQALGIVTEAVVRAALQK